MTNLQALKDLLEKVEAGDVLYADFYDLSELLKGYHGRACEAFHGSLDAARALHAAVLPGWHFNIATEANGGGYVASLSSGDWSRCLTASSSDSARAWLIAILMAMRSEGE